MPKFRLFIAADLPPLAKDTLKRLLEPVRSGFPLARFVETENLHLTLAFLGWQEEASAATVSDVVADACLNVSAIPATLTDIRIAPSLAAPRMFWCSIDRDAENKLNTLSQRLRRSLDDVRISYDSKDFRGHITLARFPDEWQRQFRTAPAPQRKQMAEAIARTLPPSRSISFSINTVTLFRSDLRPDGPVYTPLFVQTLAP
jgi:2'-5' RNA ligase